MHSSKLTPKQKYGWQEAGVVLALFLLALVPRISGLQQFVTADEAKWVYRSAQFLLAILNGDWTETAVNLTPAVTTTWLGSVGLGSYYILHGAEIALPFTEWLAAISQFRIDSLSILAATRWTMAFFSSLAIVLIYLLAKRLWGNPIALLGAIFIALDLHTLALTRIIGHDAPAALFITLSLLGLFLGYRYGGALKWMLFSGGMAGLAFLSKSPTFFLFPFVLLFMVIRVYVGQNTAKKMLVNFALWSIFAYVVFLIFWPAVWVSPLQQPYTVVENAFFSATSMDESLTDGVNDDGEAGGSLGVFYYVVNGAFKLSVPVAMGLLWGAYFLFQARKHGAGIKEWLKKDSFWLMLFSLLFVIFMTFGGKRSSRYILPVFPVLAFLAAFGWYKFFQVWLSRQPQQQKANYFVAILTLLSVLILIPYSPYYFTYYNPLFGGPLTAPHVVKIGWGEGMDQVGAWLNAQPNPEANRVGADYATTLSAYFVGQVTNPTAHNLDYIVSYVKQWQSDSPPLQVQRYYQQVVGPLETVSLVGINYAAIYPGPAARPAEYDDRLWYRPQAHFASIGQMLVVDLIHLAPDPVLPGGILTLQQTGQVKVTENESAILLSQNDASVTRHTLTVPENLPPGSYVLSYAGQPLGPIEARYGQLPANFTPTEVNFGDEIKLAGFNPDFSEVDDQFSIQLAFAATPKAWADYTVFVHLVDEAGNRLASHDAQPVPPTSQWFKGEFGLDSHLLTVPPDLSSKQIYWIKVGLYRYDTGEALGIPYTLPATIELSAETLD